MKVEASFLRSAASARDLPRDGLAEIALVGRSNVGKSSLINALVGQKIARTSAAPGKTRIVNVYRVRRGARAPFYLVDLPGYGYARGGDAAAREFEALTAEYFGRESQAGRATRERQAGRAEQAGQVGRAREATEPFAPALPAPLGSSALASRPSLAALLLVDSRHRGLASDIEAWAWMKTVAAECAVVATKIDKLARGQRIRATGELKSVLEASVLPVSAVTGEGLDELWKLIDTLASNPNNNPPLPRPKAMAPPLRRKKAPPKR